MKFTCHVCCLELCRRSERANNKVCGKKLSRGRWRRRGSQLQSLRQPSTYPRKAACGRPPRHSRILCCVLSGGRRVHSKPKQVAPLPRISNPVPPLAGSSSRRMCASARGVGVSIELEDEAEVESAASQGSGTVFSDPSRRTRAEFLCSDSLNQLLPVLPPGAVSGRRKASVSFSLFTHLRSVLNNRQHCNFNRWHRTRTGSP